MTGKTGYHRQDAVEEPELLEADEDPDISKGIHLHRYSRHQGFLQRGPGYLPVHYGGCEVELKADVLEDGVEDEARLGLCVGQGPGVPLEGWVLRHRSQQDLLRLLSNR